MKPVLLESVQQDPFNLKNEMHCSKDLTELNGKAAFLRERSLGALNVTMLRKNKTTREPLLYGRLKVSQ